MTETLSAQEIVALARHPQRVTPLEYLETLFDEFIECHGDRYYGDDQAVVGGIGFFQGQPVTVIAIQKGRNLEENITRNFGCPHPEGYRKALRLMKQAEKFHRPVILFVNTPGAFCGIEAEERGEGEAIARNLREMSQLKTPIISIFTGEGGSGGALALGVADRVWMLEYSIYSILSPEGFASILWKDSTRAGEAAEVMKLTAKELAKFQIVEEVIPESKNGRRLSQLAINHQLTRLLKKHLKELQELDTQDLLKQRYERFRKF
ncbi:acetyl-CoA carboxylase carboxyltransferase subunit alpha [Vagococcus humatus]|uniref:Acetyl-coenzyme A carboxylase carboxyl transferase subunit alpha n=1 Tax=Vagococcus humatus TaxID=1889241 RepID=A0A3R9YXZ1_9ENTE|nr:acetyl-CoA carboxylase carboxyltransferase subunit alpha [Vagococcus humatus]RST90030.1 acetyl-CoA carboxylase carboxyl transferase subunit alpha [Vagococcus humatus]